MGIGQPLPDRLLRLMSSKDRAKLGKAGVLSEEALAKAEARSERELQDMVCSYLALRGVMRVVRSAMHRKTTTAVGTPDLLFVFNDRPFAFECKMEGKHPTPEQAVALTDMARDGWHVHVIHSVREVIGVLDGKW